MSTPKEDPWPWRHWVPDGQDATDQCSHCFGPCHEEDLEAITGMDGKLYFACPECCEELKQDFTEE